MHTKLLKWICLILLFSLLGHANGGPPGAKSSVSTRNVTLGNMVVLKIRARGQNATFPVIKTIDGVKVLRQHERITNIHTYNNGKFKKERTTLVLTFAPQREMTIPSYAVEIDGKTYHTKPIKIKVKDPGKPHFAIKLKSSKDSVMVGEAFLVTVSFYLRHGALVTYQAEYNKPEFEGFFVETVDKEKHYDDGDYQVTELSYILTPHTEGNFTLGPAHAKIGIEDRSKRSMSNMGYATKWLEKASNTIDIEVKPQGIQSDLVGTFSLEAKLDHKKTKANKPVNLSVKLEGEGNLFNLDFPDYELDGVTVYSDDAKIDLKVIDGKIYSTYRKEFAFISDQSFVIPERVFKIYDLNKSELYHLTIEAKRIEVEGSTAAAMIPKNVQAGTKSEDEPAKKADLFSHQWQVTLLAFLLGVLFFYLLRYLPKRKRRDDKDSEALKILYGHMSEDAEVEEMVRKLYARKNGDKTVEIDQKRIKALIERFR